MSKKKVIATLVKSYDNEDRGYPQSICLYRARHYETLVASLRDLLGAAFKAWAATPAGKEFVKTNGKNWGDATQIPTQFLRQYGILEYAHFDGGAPKPWDDDIVVDHNETLFEED